MTWPTSACRSVSKDGASAGSACGQRSRPHVEPAAFLRTTNRQWSPIRLKSSAGRTNRSFMQRSAGQFTERCLRNGNYSPQSVCDPERGERRCFLSPHSALRSPCFLDGRACGPLLCGGTPPATPPSKTSAHRLYVVIPAVRLIQRGGGQPNTQSDNLNGGGDEALVQSDAVCGLVITRYVTTPWSISV